MLQGQSEHARQPTLPNRWGSALETPSVSAPKEGGFRFKNISKGRYTRVGMTGRQAFRIPVTAAEADETLPVELPTQRVPVP
jgi:hypothetical protein